MDDPAFDALPRAYRLGLRLRALGADDELIAECLEIDPESIVTLLDIGTAKLEHIQRGARSGRPADEWSGPQRES
jgi:hypothetical protein